MSTTADVLFARYLTIAFLLKANSKQKVRIGDQFYTPKDAARHYCGSERLTRVGVLMDYMTWLKAGINGKNVQGCTAQSST